MKHVKRISCLLLALVMVFSMASVVSAAGTGSITVENPVSGQNYTAYKIFDVVYNADKTAYSYTIAKNSEWLSTVQSYAGLALSAMVTDADGGEFYVVTKTDSYDVVAFTGVLYAAKEGKAGIGLQASGDGKMTATDLPLGYYFVTSTTGALCNLTTTDPDATIRDKNDIPFDKVDDDDSVELGQKVNYTVTGKVPDTTGFTEFTYDVTDIMSEGLTYDGTVTVKIGDSVVATFTESDNNVTKENITYHVPGTNKAGEETDFELSFDMTEYQESVGEDVVITYSATVNNKAISKIEHNHVELEYTNTPNGQTATKEDSETVYTAKIVIDKYKAGSEAIKLAGAQFVLINNGTVDGDGDGIANNANNGKYYKLDNGKVTWVSELKDATVVTTDANGAASFEGLEDGSYLLREIKAPDGYNMLDQDIPITINGKDATATNLSSLTYEEDVANSTGSTLPETGGIGTTIFYILGSVLVLAAVVVLVAKKRMSTTR